MDPRRVRDASDAVYTRVDRVAGRQMRALSRFAIWLYVIAPAIVVGPLVSILLIVWALTLPPWH